MEFHTAITPLSLKEDFSENTKAHCVVGVKLIAESGGFKLMLTECQPDPSYNDIYVLVSCNLSGQNWFIIDRSKNLYSVVACKIDTYYCKDPQPDEMKVGGVRYRLWVDPARLSISIVYHMLVVEAVRRFSSEIFKDD